jgi:thiol-disulfide isomerase/thioredoxin
MKKLLLILPLLLTSNLAFAKIQIVSEKKVDDLVEESLKSHQRLMVVVFAKWCSWCKVEEPLLVEAQKRLGDKVRIVEIDIDKSKDLKQVVRALPTQVVVLGIDEDQKPIFIRHEGAFQSVDEILKMFDTKIEDVKKQNDSEETGSTSNKSDGRVEYTVQDRR